MRYLLLTLSFSGICVLIFSCQKAPKRFRPVPASESGIDFANTIVERDTTNILDMEFVYNGGGVAIGDLNGDGLDDLYFTGNQVDNRLYLNRGNLRFEDVTQAAGAGKTKPYQWSGGINLVDINLDGRLDIYVCNSINPDPEQRRNLLFVNTGNDAQGIPKFAEQGHEYGLDDPNHDSNAQFFDYDNDGDLDCFLSVNFIDHQYPNQFFNRTSDGSSPTRDILLRNDWNAALGHGVFTDVSLAAGIVWAGYSHSALIYDFNEDGWQDIFVANDYLSNDLLYINQRNGTFKNEVARILRHQAMSSMGTDLADLSNDGRPDFFATEMQPWYNKRKKLFQGGSSYQMYLFNEQYKYEYQYTRNMLQLNRGLNPDTGLPIFSEIGLFAGVQETDWSWTPLMADFDNDGWRDLYVSNGFPRDVTDHDFAEFRKSIASTVVSKNDLYQMIPQIKFPNFLFHQNAAEGSGGVPRFADVAADWGLSIPSFTNGAAYADLDRDGDLDLVCNNINDPAFLFENQSVTPNSTNSTTSTNPTHYLRVHLKGSEQNPLAFGAKITAHFGGQRQAAVVMSARGYLSVSEHTAHFGLGSAALADSVVVEWPTVGAERRVSVARQVPADQVLELSYATATASAANWVVNAPATMLVDIANSLKINYKDEENDHIDFNFQRTLPHKFSQYGPCLAVGDVTGDGLADAFIGGSSRYGQHWLVQLPNGTFRTDSSSYKTDQLQREEDSAALLFDADNDGDLDLYLGRGSAQFPAGDTLYRDALYLNNGKGKFSLNPAALPLAYANTSVVRAADWDHDGDLDLFVGSRVKPKSYPLPDRSFLLENDGQGRFTDVTAQKAPQLAQIGLISDAIWSDYDGDNWPDLVLAAEFLPVTFVKNNGGQNLQITTTTLPSGWWNSLSPADFDNDGDTDYVATNFGENLYFKASANEPLRVYGKDFDNNGWVDPFVSVYWQDSLHQRHEYFYSPREDAVKQLVLLRKKFKTYGEYGTATVPQFFNAQELEGATILAATEMRSALIENLGNGQFKLHPLPPAAQIAPLYGALPRDVDGDGLLDLLLTGNDYGIELQQGRADAFCGLVLRNLGNWQFAAVDNAASGFWVNGEARGLVGLPVGTQREAILAVQNRGLLRAYGWRQATPDTRLVVAERNEVSALLTLANGQKRRVELPWGVGFSAQTGRYVALGGPVRSVAFFNQQGEATRSVSADVMPSK